MRAHCLNLDAGSASDADNERGSLQSADYNDVSPNIRGKLAVMIYRAEINNIR